MIGIVSKAQKIKRNESLYTHVCRIQPFSTKIKPKTSVLWNQKRASLPSAARLKLPSKKSLLPYQSKPVLNLMKLTLSLSQEENYPSARLKHREQKSVNERNLAKTRPKSLVRYLSPRSEDLQLRTVQEMQKRRKSSQISEISWISEIIVRRKMKTLGKSRSISRKEDRMAKTTTARHSHTEA